MCELILGQELNGLQNRIEVFFFTEGTQALDHGFRRFSTNRSDLVLVGLLAGFANPWHAVDYLVWRVQKIVDDFLQEPGKTGSGLAI